MSYEPIHITFSPSAHASVSEALAIVNRNERVIVLPDDLSLGPLTPRDARLAWWRSECAVDMTDAAGPQAEFWSLVASREVVPTIWMSRNSPSESCGFLAVLQNRQANLPTLVMDVWDLVIPGADGEDLKGASSAFAYVPAAAIVENQLFARAVPLDLITIAQCMAMWGVLQHENAALRVSGENGVVSAPIDYYDELIISRTTAAWKVCARVVYETLRLTPASDTFIWPRLLKLIEAGELEGKADGESWDMYTLNVRRPTRAERRQAARKKK